MCVFVARQRPLANQLSVKELCDQDVSSRLHVPVCQKTNIILVSYNLSILGGEITARISQLHSRSSLGWHHV